MAKGKSSGVTHPGTRKATIGHPLAEDEQALLRAQVAALGVSGVAAILDISKNTITRAAAGAGLRNGTLLLLRTAMPRLRDAG